MSKETAPATDQQPTQTAPATEQQPVNYNKKYRELKLDVEAVMKKTREGAETINFYKCDVGKEIKTVMIEKHRADQMNRAFESRRIIYWPFEEPVPTAIKRISKYDEETGETFWKDEYTYPTKA